MRLQWTAQIKLLLGEKNKYETKKKDSIDYRLNRNSVSNI